MRLIIFLFFCGFQVFGQEISCNYKLLNNYTCNLTITNPNGFDGFENIPGEHLEGFSDDDVREIRLSAGFTSNFPLIICQKFKFATRIWHELDVQPLEMISEGALWNCANLDFISIRISALTLPPSLLIGNPLLHTYICSRCNFTDLPMNFFQSNPLLAVVTIASVNLHQFRPEWFQNHKNIERISIQGSPQLNFMPRNSFNSPTLNMINYPENSFHELDFFSFNQIESLIMITIGSSNLQNNLRALDFNIFDRAQNLSFFLALNIATPNCGLSSSNFNGNREQSMAALEGCFAAFDNRILTFSTSGLTQTFNSIRRERILLRVQTASDAIITFSNNPDGSGSNFEIHLGVNGNSRSEIFENGVMVASASTPGLLNLGRFEEFDITWQGGLIFVRNPNPLMVHIRSDLFAVRFVGVKTRGITASWIIQQITG